MRKAILALLLVDGWGAAAAAQAAGKPGAAPPEAAVESERGVEDPRAFVAAMYEAYRHDENGPEMPAFAYSDRLRALFDAHQAWTATHDDLVGALDFDWWVNAQDWSIEDVRVTETRDRELRIVSAHFTNDGRPDEIRFVFVRQGGRWFLNDAIEGTGSGDGGWRLSDLLQQRSE